MAKYYLDAAIWIDYYEDRADRFRPLGDWAHRLLALIKTNKEIVLISDFLLEEIETQLSSKEVNNIISTYKSIMQKVEFSRKQSLEAEKISKERKVPFGDVLHAIIARDNHAILITRDNHFQKITDITTPVKPEEIIQAQPFFSNIRCNTCSLTL